MARVSYRNGFYRSCAETGLLHVSSEKTPASMENRASFNRPLALRTNIKHVSVITQSRILLDGCLDG